MKKPIRKLFFCLDVIALTGAALVHSATAVQGLRVASAAAVVMNAASGEVIYGKAPDKPMYPASTTKVMTALLLIEYAGTRGFEERVTMSRHAVESIGWDASNIGLSAGDSLTLRECLYAIMLASANEVCVGVAEHIAGSEKAFADMMNARARSLGAENTHFTNPHGLPDRNHITTAYDIALIMREAIRKPAFREAISAREYVAYPNGDMSAPLLMTNKNLLIQEGIYYRDYVVGGKTGYTSAARHTLVNYAAEGGAELICVTMRAPNYMTYPDTIALFEYGFEHMNEAPRGRLTGAAE